MLRYRAGFPSTSRRTDMSANSHSSEVLVGVLVEVSAEIVNIGDELLSGDVVNTNATFLADRCRRLGLVIERIHVVRDRVEEIATCIREVAARSRIGLVSGGLGPTTDDCTSDALAVAAGLPLLADPGALTRLQDKWKRFGRPMPEANRKQADFPSGAEILSNPVGTAEGFRLLVGESQFFVMPGVPLELRKMMVEQVEPRLRESFALQPIPRRTYRVLGLGESSLAERLEPVFSRARRRSSGLAAMFVHYRASTPEVQVILEATADSEGNRATAEELEGLDEEIVSAAGPALFGLGSASLAARLIRALANHGLRLSTAESCTAGGV